MGPSLRRPGRRSGSGRGSGCRRTRRCRRRPRCCGHGPACRHPCQAPAPAPAAPCPARHRSLIRPAGPSTGGAGWLGCRLAQKRSHFADGPAELPLNPIGCSLQGFEVALRFAHFAQPLLDVFSRQGVPSGQPRSGGSHHRPLVRRGPCRVCDGAETRLLWPLGARNVPGRRQRGDREGTVIAFCVVATHSNDVPPATTDDAMDAAVAARAGDGRAGTFETTTPPRPCT